MISHVWLKNVLRSPTECITPLVLYVQSYIVYIHTRKQRLSFEKHTDKPYFAPYQHVPTATALLKPVHCTIQSGDRIVLLTAVIWNLRVYF